MGELTLTKRVTEEIEEKYPDGLIVITRVIEEFYHNKINWSKMEREFNELSTVDEEELDTDDEEQKKWTGHKCSVKCDYIKCNKSI
jgi:sirohydrochlorin ferrochelatase